MSSQQRFRPIISLLILIVVCASIAVPQHQAFAQPEPLAGFQPTPTLYRTMIGLRGAYDIARLARIGVALLSVQGSSAMVLADQQQLAALARLRFEPRQTEVYTTLLRTLSSARLTTTALATAAATDSDGDGLSDAQEGWWCTNPTQADSDGDRVTDGAEVQALKDWIGNRRSSPPASGKPFLGWPPRITNCYDDDQDAVPDMAETYELGLNPNRESTDRDKFDDGQELFGQTYCTGQGGFCSYGPLPRNEDWGVIFAEMPTWVKAPGNHPLVAAFPIPEIDVVENSLHVQTVTTITTDHTISTGTEKTYSTAKTEGTSTSVANTTTWNEWEETSITTPLASSTELQISSYARQRVSATTNGQQAQIPQNSFTMQMGNAFNIGDRIVNALEMPIKVAEIGYKYGEAINKGIYVGTRMYLDMKSGGEVQWPRAYLDEYKDLYETEHSVNQCPPNCGGGIKSSTQEGLTFQDSQGQNYTTSRDGQTVTTTPSNVITQRFYPISSPLPLQPPSRTEAKGKSWGGAQTTTNTQYEEQTVTTGEAFSTGDAWSSGTAVDASHAAELWFSYKVRNSGQEYAREIGNLAFNIYLNDDPNPLPTYFVAIDLGGDGTFKNFMPGQERTFTISRRVSLTLDELKALDVDPSCALKKQTGQMPSAQTCPGGKLRVVLEDFSYGIDQLFYQDAINAGVRIAIEDGVSDIDAQGKINEQIDSYVIPTWGDETVLDVLARYFPHEADPQGNLTAIWTPEYRSDQPLWCADARRYGTTLWCKQALSTAEWWNVYLSGLGDGSEGFQSTPAAPGSVALFRFNQDTDHDGYSDRSELKLGTDARDAASVPHPELIGGVHNIQAGSTVTSTLALLNTGTYDAYGVEAVMVAPDDSISILNNTVGGSGRVRALKQVTVGSRVVAPSTPGGWHGTAKPFSGGYFTGAQDRSYTFTVNCSLPAGCEVGKGSWSLSWSDNAGTGSTLSMGAGYASPNLKDVAQGIKIGLLSGQVTNGDWFVVAATTPRDTFQYRINRQPFTPPVVIVSYNDPQGNHRFVIPPAAMSLDRPDADLQPFVRRMLPDLGLELLTSQAASPGANRLRLVVNNPSPSTLRNAKLILNLIDPQGTVVAEVPTTATLPPGPTLVPVEFNTSSFSPAYNASQDYIVLAFWTDYEGNILDTAGRPLASFQADPTPHLVANSASWSFGTVARNTLLRQSIELANIGGARLFSYVDAPAELHATRSDLRSGGPADVVRFDLALDTTTLPLGPYDRTITIRTSDVDTPTVSVRVTGTIASAASDTTPGGTRRPLDWPVTVASGTQGTWVEYTHTLGPEPQSLHPVRMYSQNYGQLWGVGRYATDFGQGTASSEMFGDGHDGAMPGSGNLDTNNGFGLGIVNGGSAGSASINVTDAYGGWRINANDAVLIHQTQGSGAGCWESNKALSDYAGGTADIQLATPLKCTYASGGGNHAQILRIPQYSVCNVTGTVTPIYAWNGSTGGIFAVMCRDTMTISGAVEASGYGYRGASRPDNMARASGRKGESYAGDYNTVATSTAANNSGGGGAYNNNADAGSGGGAGGHAALGGAGRLGHSTNGSGPGQGGAAVGDQNLITAMYMGGGGGSGSNSYTSGSGSDFGGAGGNGGGIVLLSARSLTITGVVQANGATGSDSTGHATGGGGAGAGGAVLIQAQTASVGTALIRARGGVGGAGGAFSLLGGDGGDGRNAIRYCESYAGEASPPISAQKLSCFVAEQVEAAPYDHGRLNLPETFGNGRTYHVQYGRRFNFISATSASSVIQVPGGLYSNAALEALVSGAGNGPFTLQVDIGDDGSWEWQETRTLAGAATFSSPELAAAFNAYWVSQGGRVGSLNVPVRVAVSGASQVLLANLRMEQTGSRLRQVRLPARSYQTVTLNLSVGEQGGGALSLAADVGDNGSIDWTGSSTAAFPARLTTGNLASALNTYLAGKNGDVDVPIRFYLSPFVPLTLDGLNTSEIVKPDVTVSAGDIRVNANNVTEGTALQLSTTLRNPSGLPSGGATAAFFANVPGWGDWYIGSRYIANIPAGGTADITVPWATYGFAGDIPVRVVLDPYNRTAEQNETNNQAQRVVAITPALQMSTTSLSFGDQQIYAESAAKSLTLTNRSARAISIGTFSSPSAAFSVSSACPSLLLPGTSCALSLRFKPTERGPIAVQLPIPSDSGYEYMLELSGTGVGEPPARTLDIALTSLSFSAQPVGTTSAARSIAVRSVGSQSVSIASITASGDFSVSHTCPALLSPQSSCMLNVTFHPLAAGVRQGAIVISSNAVASPQRIGLSGIGVGVDLARKLYMPIARR